MRRREFLELGALAAGGAFSISRVSFAAAASRNASRFVFVILRGALDGLAAVPPYADRDYASLRRDLALHPPGTSAAVLPLNGFFGLHPSLGFLHESYLARELVVFHALASPYRDRSHFDGQDVLESGLVRPHAAQTGWLNRALAAIPASRGADQELGVALGQNIPLVMRGSAPVTSWSPSKLSALDEDTLMRIGDLYAADPLLAARLAEALAADAMADTSRMHDKPELARSSRYGEVVEAAAGFLRRDDGPKVAVFDTTGWDTHASEGGAEGQLANRLAGLDAGLRLLKDELGPIWNDTVVLLATEFGRTAAINGTRGTDHGTATVAFALGGPIHGGRVIADWPGLAPRALYQGRDLLPTLDLRAVIKGLLSDHLRISTRALENAVFPDSAHVRPLTGLLRA